MIAPERDCPRSFHCLHLRGLSAAFSALALVVLLTASPLYAIEITSIVVTGNTVDIGIEKVIRTGSGSFTEEEIRLMAAGITDLYHAAGYATSYVDKMIIRKDGALDIRIRESKIAAITVQGLSESLAGEVKAFLRPLQGRLYNTRTLQEHAEILKSHHRLSAISMSAVNAGQEGDVELVVRARRRSYGDFYGGVYSDAIYGVTPRLGYTRNMASFGFSIESAAAFREGAMRRSEGRARIAWPVGGAFALLLMASAVDSTEVWQSRQLEYSETAFSSGAGALYRGGMFASEITFTAHTILLDNYHAQERRASGAAGRLSIRISDGEFVLVKRRTKSAEAALEAGADSVEPDGYCNATFAAECPLAPLPWVLIRPRVDFFHTSSCERYRWRYVFDNALPGFPEDYTAADTRALGSVRLEFEVFPELLFAGPMYHAGYFRDELTNWTFKSSIGAQIVLVYESLTAGLSFSWDAESGPAHGFARLDISARF